MEGHAGVDLWWLQVSSSQALPGHQRGGSVPSFMNLESVLTCVDVLQKKISILHISED